MEVIQQLWFALWHQDIAMLTTPTLIWTFYGILFLIILLENSLLPAAFLPGDSLLIFVGVLSAKDALNYPLAIFILTIAASLGSWLGFIQGRWLSNTKIIKHWLGHIPEHYHQRAHTLFHRHGLAALFIGRFIGFVRTLLPPLIGLSGLNNRRFIFFNTMSAFLWITTLITAGFTLGQTTLFYKYQEDLTRLLLLIPIALLFFGLVFSLFFIIKKKRRHLTKKMDN